MAASSPPSSTSRFSQIFRARSISSDYRSDMTDHERRSTPPGSEARHPISTRQRLEFPVGSVSSSMTIPARSYFQRPFHPSSVTGGALPTSSTGVRQDTAELASRAIAENDGRRPTQSPLSTLSPPPLPHAHTDQQIFLTTDPAGPSHQSVKQRQSSTGTQPPPKPSAPPDAAPPSMLAQMIRNSPPKTLPEAESEVFTDDDDDSVFGVVTVRPATLSQPHEQTALLHESMGKLQSYGVVRPEDDVERQGRTDNDRAPGVRNTLKGWAESSKRVGRLAVSPKSWDKTVVWEQTVVRPARCLPAVLLGLLLNILDALSYGMILFPLGQPLFADLGPDGISMFYVSCIVSQLVYSLGGSVFRGGVGSEMIEVVPFFHQMAFTIMQRVGDNPRAVLATTVLSYSLSSILTGLVFFLLGQCRLGLLIGFFPRHILIGCIGGVGWFLVATGVEVSAGLDGNLEYNLETLRHLFDADTVALWTIPLALALTLFIVKRFVRHSLTDAVYFISVVIIFYIVVAAIPNLDVSDLRGTGWVFEAPPVGVPWWHFYTLYDFAVVDWGAIVQTVPAMFALTFFGVLHVPINVPALGLSTGEDNVDVDRELKAHGYSNALSGMLGSIQNYLVYTNTVLFMRSGGDSRLAGVMLAVATFGILVAGPAIIGFIPVMVVGTLIFFLGLDLMREAILDTIGRVNKLEYLTILIIVVTMGAYDFVVGILVGVVLACVSYVFQTSQISAIRGTLPGGLANSMVRRHPMQHRFLKEVGRQIYVMKLAGYLFFGTIVGVENSIRAVLRDDAFNSRPIQFLVIDLSKVDGVDFSAAEAFTRINRILVTRNVRLILSGFHTNSAVGRSLQNVGLLDTEDGVEFFEVLNAALEYCENELLKAFYQQRSAMLDTQHRRRSSGTRTISVTSKTLDVPVPPPPSQLSNSTLFPSELDFASPRRGQLRTAAATTLREQDRILPSTGWQRQPQPLQLIVQTFANFSDRHDLDFWAAAVPFFTRHVFPQGTVLYNAGDLPDGFYLLETGILRATYHLFSSASTQKASSGAAAVPSEALHSMATSGDFTEVIAAGATCGELPFFSDTLRTATVLAERESVAWVLHGKEWERCQAENPLLAAEILKIGLRLTSERLMSMAKYMLLAGT